MGLTASSSWFVFTVALAFAKLDFINFLASLFGPDFIWTLEFGIDTVGHQNMPSVNSVFATGFLALLSDWDSDCLSLSDCES